MASPPFNTAFEPRYGEAVEIAPGIRRITARNPGPFTFHGTNTYLVGSDPVAVIDPGPDDAEHAAAILKAVGGATVSHIIITHTHRDHSAGLAALKARTGARVLGEGRHRPARALRIGEINPLDASADRTFAPEEALADGDRVQLGGITLEAIATPGHCEGHYCLLLRGNDRS